MDEQDHKSAPSHRPVALIILDGWGIGRDEPGNAVLAADTPVMDRLWETYPHATLLTSGEAVGLPAGQMGNSEVGHMNLGAGFIVYQWISRIDKSIADGEFDLNPVFLKAIDRTKKSGAMLHLMGLVSDGGVHSHTRHLVALVRLAASHGLERIAIHAFTDGRDTSPTSGLGFLQELQKNLNEMGAGRIATVSGRYYAMDRDKRWERTKPAYDAIVQCTGPSSSSFEDVVREAYAAGTTDEFIKPTVILDPQGSPTPINSGDTVISFNYRSDRMRQLIAALSESDFTGFDRGVVPSDLEIVTMTRYEKGLPVEVAFAPKDVLNPVSRVISDAGLAQFHSAETEKYPHVTFFFNGGREDAFAREERAMVPSPKVATYDLQPEMSADGVTEKVINAIVSGAFNFVIVNFANSDMVGHTGVFDAAVRAVETADRDLGRILETLEQVGGVAIVTADHGNAEEMIDRVTGGPMTAHTTNPVPVVLFSPEGDALRKVTLREGAVLSSVAPTILELLGLESPAEMDEKSLID